MSRRRHIRRPKRRPTRLAIAALCLAATACGANATITDNASSAEPGASAGAAPGESAAPALFGEGLPTVDGGQLSDNDIAGQDVVLWFWAPW